MTDPNVIADQQRYVKLTREYRDLEHILQARKEYVEALSGRDEARELMQTESDPEMKEMAREQLQDCEARIPEIEEKIKVKGESCVIQANMPFLFAASKMGARGVMATPTACGGIFFRRYHDAFTSGDEELATQRYNEITLLDNAIDSGFNRSAKYLVQLRGVKGFKDISRGDRFPLSSARRQSLRSFAEWAKENGLF